VTSLGTIQNSESLANGALTSGLVKMDWSQLAWARQGGQGLTRTKRGFLLVTHKQLGTRRKKCEKRLMRAQYFFLIVIFALLALPRVGSTQQKTPDADRVIALERKWTQAYKQRDIRILSSLLADEFVITVEDGSTYSKVGYISHSAETSVHVQVAELTELKVRVHADVAVVTGAYHETGTSKGKPYEYSDRLTDIWVKSPGGWQVTASHYSVPLTPSATNSQSLVAPLTMTTLASEAA
jgi:ketosteroid isomerase-like protein